MSELPRSGRISKSWLNRPRRDSSAGDDDLNAARIAEQEKELAELTELREALLRNSSSIER